MGQQTDISSSTRHCLDVIKKCDKALDDKNKALELSDLATLKCSKELGDRTVKLEDTRDALRAWYHNPIVMGLLGAAAGITTYTLLRK